MPNETKDYIFVRLPYNLQQPYHLLAPKATLLLCGTLRPRSNVLS